MRPFKKKPSSDSEQEIPRELPTPTPEVNFYSQPNGEVPLHEQSGVGGGRPERRTSRHNAAHWNNDGNRSSRAVAVLLLRTVLIVLLLAVGFWGLKLILEYLSGPSEKEQQQWEKNAEIMEKGTDLPDMPKIDLSSEIDGNANATLIEERLERWNLAERLFRTADALDQRGLYEEAAEKLTQALKVVPESQAAQTLLMKIYMRTDAYADAIPVCIHLLDQDSGQRDVQMNLLQALHQNGQVDAGLLLADQMLDKQPNDMDVLEIAAEACLARGDLDRALNLFDRMLFNDSRNEVALKGTAAIYSSRNEWEKAIPYYLELIRIAPEPDAYQALALCYAQIGEEGKTTILMGQAAGLFGEGAVKPWLQNPGFDPVRETVDFRAFADRVVGIETRRAIEAIRRREVEKKEPILPAGMDITTPGPELKRDREKIENSPKTL